MASFEERDAAGVPVEEAPKVAELAEVVAKDVESYGAAALGEPLMLLRFLRARQGDVAAAAKMWRETHAWRGAHIPVALGEIGEFREAGDGPLDGAPAGREPRWSWSMFQDPARCATPRGALALKHGQAIRLLAPTARDGSPVLLWRMGGLDLPGCAREDLIDTLSLRQVAHLEDAIQFARAQSNRERRLVRCRVVIDLKGIAILRTIPHISTGLKPTMKLGTAFFPEITASVTIVNAPFAFETLWKLISIFLNDCIRAKVRIVGSNFADALTTHAMIDDIAALPKSLGGQADDYGAPEPVEAKAGAAIDRADPFVKARPAED